MPFLPTKIVSKWLFLCAFKEASSVVGYYLYPDSYLKCTLIFVFPPFFWEHIVIKVMSTVSTHHIILIFWGTSVHLLFTFWLLSAVSSAAVVKIEQKLQILSYCSCVPSLMLFELLLGKEDFNILPWISFTMADPYLYTQAWSKP